REGKFPSPRNLD
ncbi:hypothetical protein CFC21_098273, partial [Triticum aestivum]